MLEVQVESRQLTKEFSFLVEWQKADIEQDTGM